MTTWRLSKVMTRNPTDEERAEVKKYLKDNDVLNKPMSFIDDAVSHFEKKWNMPVTKSLIEKSIVEMMIDGELNERIVEIDHKFKIIPNTPERPDQTKPTTDPDNPDYLEIL